MQLGVRDVARLLGVSEKSIYRWIQQGQLPAYKVQDQYRFNRSELIEWATSRRINVRPDALSDPDDSAEIMPSFAESLQGGGIFYRVEARDKASALRAVVDTMRLPPNVDREFLLSVLLARESMASTGIGEGIAIPHARNPIVLSVRTPTVCLCFLEKPVEFGAVDGQPVHTLFTLVSPTVRMHLYLLSRLSYALLQPGFRDAVNRQADREAIVAAAAEAETAMAQANAAAAKEPA